MMRFLLLVVLLLVLVYYLRKRRSSAGPPPSGPQAIRVGSIPAVLRQLAAAGVEGSFVVVIFRSPDADPAADRVNLQLSIEDGRPGLDWILLTSANVRDRERFTRFAAERGHAVGTREMDEVPYLRVEDGDPAELAMRVMLDRYRLAPEDEVELLVEGFHAVL